MDLKCSISIERAFDVEWWVKEEDKEMYQEKNEKQIDFNYNYIW
jgi:hypothetical protein